MVLVMSSKIWPMYASLEISVENWMSFANAVILVGERFNKRKHGFVGDLRDRLRTAHSGPLVLKRGHCSHLD